MTHILQRLRRALRIEPGEGKLVTWSAVALFLVESAAVAASNVSDTLFLKRIGVEYLPIVFLANSILLAGTTFAAGRVAVRFDQGRLLLGTFLALSAVLLVLWALVAVSAPGIEVMLVIASKQIDVIALLLFWAAMAGLMTSRQNKRLVALMTAGGTLGTIAGSFASGPFGRLFGIPSLLAMAAAGFAAAALVAVPLARARRRQTYRGRIPEAAGQRPQLRVLWRDSSLFRALIATSFLAGTLGPMLYFEFSRAADLATRTADGEQRLLALYGVLRGWMNVGVLVVQVGGSAALFRRVGVPAAAALAPAAYLVGFAGLGIRFGLPTAMPAVMSTNVLDHTLYEPGLRILGALLPRRFRVAATSMIQGPAKRAGAAVGSLLVLTAVAVFGAPAVSLAALPIAGLWMTLSLLLWKRYPNLLLEAASIRRNEPESDDAALFLDAATSHTLQDSLEGPDAIRCRAACELFVYAPSRAALEALSRAVARAPSANRSILLEALERVLKDPAATDSVDDALAARLVRALRSAPDLSATERATLLQVLGRICVGSDYAPDAREMLERASNDATEAVRAVARIARARLSGPESAPSLDDILAATLASDDAAIRRIAVSELRYELLRAEGGSALHMRRLYLLTAQLGRDARNDGGDDPRLARLRAENLEVLADVALVFPNEVVAFGPAVVALAEDRDCAVRAAVLRFIGNAGLVVQAELLAERLSSRSTVEAQAARASIERLGPLAADALLHALHQGGRRARQVVPEILRDLHIETDVLRTLIEREITSTRKLLVVLGVLHASGQSRLLLQRLRERAEESMRCALELVAAELGDDRISNVCRSLARGRNLRDRAVLLEALEALLPAAERARILPLLEDDGFQRLALEAARALGRSQPTLEQALEQVLALRDSLATALIAATTDRELLWRVAPDLDMEAALRVFRVESGDGTDAPDAEARALPSVAEEHAMLSPVEKMLRLKSLDLFEGLSTQQLSELARVVREVTVQDEGVILRQGEFDDSMYFIVDGRVRIIKDGEAVVELGAGDFFGEMSVFDGERRSATASAVGEAALLRLARDDLFEVMEDQPAIGIGICQTLVRRLRDG